MTVTLRSTIVEPEGCHGRIILQPHGRNPATFFFASEDCPHCDAQEETNPPVWLWQNPEAPMEDISLHPSLIWSSDGEEFHGYVRDGGFEAV